jgi:hypothetical protein
MSWTTEAGLYDGVLAFAFIRLFILGMSSAVR